MGKGRESLGSWTLVRTRDNGETETFDLGKVRRVTFRRKEVSKGRDENGWAIVEPGPLRVVIDV